MSTSSGAAHEDSVAAQAVAYACRGWPVLPLHGVAWAATGLECTCARGPVCASPGKHPLTGRGLLEATTDVRAVLAWFERWPFANVGVRTGARPYGAGFIALDVDPRHGGDDSLYAVEREHGELPATLTALTGGGGEHRFFLHPGEWVVTRAELAPGVDVRGDGGYVVAPPSRHLSGQRYAWEGFDDAPSCAAAPGWLLALLREQGRREQEARRPQGPLVVTPGGRNQTLIRTAGALRRIGWDEETIGDILRLINRTRFTERLADDEVLGVARNGARYEPAESIPVQPAPGPSLMERLRV